MPTSVFEEDIKMSHTATMEKQERCMRENAAAAALVDVASSFPQQTASDSTSGSGLPSNSASRRLWDREQAGPSTDHGFSDRAEAYSRTFPPSVTQTASLAAAAVAAGANWPDAGALYQMGTAPNTTHVSASLQQSRDTYHQSMLNMSMSSIGFGVDSACSSGGNATEAAYRAVRDAMERSAVRMPSEPHHRQNLSIHVKLGVPAKPSGEPMYVDVERLAPLLPRAVPVQPVEMRIGGLLIDHKEMEPTRGTESAAHHPTICTAVACVTLQQLTTSSEVEAAMAGNHGQEVADQAPLAQNHWPDLDQPDLKASQSCPPSLPHQGRTLSTSSARTSHGGVPLPSQVNVHRSNSMEVLALISGEMRERHLNSQRVASEDNVLSGAATSALAIENNVESSSLASGDSNKASVTAYSYKKLAPGMTPKNNKRLFVRHSYRDYSHEDPLPEEHYLVRSQDSPARTPNAAFPLRLHEILTQIEQDGYGHIIGWMPHGRSFKIHKQQEFVTIVLPKYFVMTKKSSFLRQLNLYGFNRISVGADGGSYYHEKFLRGLKFLCRRMARQKVNGNGIRAAGNPDEEPTLSRFPACPPSAHGVTSCNSSVTQNDEHSQQDLVVDSASHPQTHSLYVRSTEKESMMVTDENSHASHGSANDVGAKPQLKQNRSQGSSTAVSSAQVSFPLKLHRLLDKMEAEGNTEVISWLPHGRAFLVHDVERFVLDIMTQYFNQTKYSSFQRQLHMYNFQRITFGRDKGAYHHPSFQRGRPNLCLSMVRTRVNGKGCRRPGDPDGEPCFYEQEYLPPIPKGTIIEMPTEVSTWAGNEEDAETKSSGVVEEEVGQRSEV